MMFRTTFWTSFECPNSLRSLCIRVAFFFLATFPFNQVCEISFQYVPIRWRTDVPSQTDSAVTFKHKYWPILFQIFGTALLLICVLAIMDKHNMKPSSGTAVISIGLSVVGIGMSFGLNCSYAINPTRDLAPRIFTAVAGWGKAPFS